MFILPRKFLLKNNKTIRRRAEILVLQTSEIFKKIMFEEFVQVGVGKEGFLWILPCMILETSELPCQTSPLREVKKTKRCILKNSVKTKFITCCSEIEYLSEVCFSASYINFFDNSTQDKSCNSPTI